MVSRIFRYSSVRVGRISILLAALSCGASATGAQVSYKFYRFTPIKLRNDASSSAVSLSEFQLLRAGNPVSYAGATATNPEGNAAASGQPANVLDGDTSTQWLDPYKSPLIIGFPAATAVDGYRFSTSVDGPERDPVRWTLEGSADGATWMLVDYITSDYATPTARLTSTENITLPATPDQVDRKWTGSPSPNWNTTTANWSNGKAVKWDNTRLDTAHFSSSSKTAVTITEPITVRNLQFDGTGYNLQGSAITFTANACISGNGGSATISAPVAGGLPVVKVGTSSVDLTAANTFTGPVSVRGGTLSLSGSNASAGSISISGGGTLNIAGPTAFSGAVTVTGGTLNFSGTATKPGAGSLVVGDTRGKGIMQLSDTAAVVFNGTARVGNNTGSSGAIRQSGGSATYGADGYYLTMGNLVGSYGSYELSGGKVVTVADSGVRVGYLGNGVYTQTGGDMKCGRWFAAGGSRSVATFTGGTASVSSEYRLIVGDQTGVGTVNIGTEAGGNAVFTALRGDGAVAIGNGPGTTGYLNLNRGALALYSRIYAVGNGAMNLNGGTIRAGTSGAELFDASLGIANLYRDGVIVETNDRNASISGNIGEVPGKGLYPAGGVIAVPAGAGGSGYIGAPLVDVSTSGLGVSASAVATVSNGSVTGVTLSCPGTGYAAGDTLTFTFIAGGADIPAVPFVHTITAADLAANNTGGFTKTGTARLTLSGQFSFPGTISVTAGTLESNGLIDRAPISVEAGAILGGLLNTNAPVTIKGTLAPGSAINSTVAAAHSSSSVTFAPGSAYAMQISNWEGVAGTGYDTAGFSAASIIATPASKFTVNVDGTGITNFSETAKQFTILTAGSAPTGLTDSNWQVTTSNFTGTGVWSLAVKNSALVLFYTPSVSGYSTWAAGFTGLGNTSLTGDPDGDGIPNVLEYVLNGDPTVASRSILPQGAISGTNYVFTFVRRAESKGDIIQSFDYSSDLSTWTSIAIPSATSGSVKITANQPSSGLETVVVTVQKSAVVNGRLFGRLSVTTP